MNFEHEFGTVELLLKSDFKTRGVDSFVLSLIKVERQIRKIFTYLIFQNENFGSIKDMIELRTILSKNRDMYFVNFILGIDKIYYKSTKEIYGEEYDEDYNFLKDYTKDRNKIFHGQLTHNRLSREDLIKRVTTMIKWSKQISTKFSEEIGYDGFGRNSYRKSENQLKLKNTHEYSSIKDYKNFLKTIDRKGS